MPKIIVADDEEKLVRLISDFFVAAGYSVVSAFDGNEAVAALKDNSDADAVILDIMMPNLNGWEAAGEIRKFSLVPIVFLSARQEEFDMLESFRVGADEYVTKPFSPAVLVQRVTALVNRNRMGAQKNNEPLKIDKTAFVVKLYDKEISFTLKEFELLSYLYDNRGIILSRDQLLDAVWGFDYSGDTRTVDTHIARIRLKLGDYGATHLKTIYGYGYKLEAQE